MKQIILPKRLWTIPFVTGLMEAFACIILMLMPTFSDSSLTKAIFLGALVGIFGALGLWLGCLFLPRVAWGTPVQIKPLPVLLMGGFAVQILWLFMYSVDPWFGSNKPIDLAIAAGIDMAGTLAILYAAYRWAAGSKASWPKCLLIRYRRGNTDYIVTSIHPAVLIGALVYEPVFVYFQVWVNPYLHTIPTAASTWFLIGAGSGLTGTLAAAISCFFAGNGKHLASAAKARN